MGFSGGFYQVIGPETGQTIYRTDQNQKLVYNKGFVKVNRRENVL
jgi:hypothetical protein